MAFRSNSYLQDSFRDSVNAARERSYLGAFNALSENSPTNSIIQSAFKDDGEDVNAFSQGASMAATGTGWLQGMNTSLQGISAQNVATGFNRASTAISRQQELETAEEIYKNQKEAYEDAQSSSTFGTILDIGTKVAGFALCERRLKTDIAPVDADWAWATIRDLPLYSFYYKHNPSIPAYGPMVDEVEQLDPSLLWPMDQEARELGIADGEPIRGVDQARRQIYESAALQQALQRIEALEARLAQLEGQALTPASSFIPLAQLAAA
jgi:hypothetical protein